MIDLEIGKHEAMPDAPGDQCFEMEISPDGKSLALSLEGANTPEDIWLLDTVNGKYRQLTHSPHPGVAIEDMVSPEKVSFKSRDGKELSGWLYRPKGQTTPAPYVVAFTGGLGFNAQIQGLLSQGIGVFYPRIREVSPFQDKDPNAIATGNAIDNEKNDIAAAAEYLLSSKLAIPGAIGICGQSHAGRLAMTAVTEFPDLFAAGEEDFGVMNFMTLRKEQPADLAARSSMLGVDPKLQEQVFHRLSIVEHLDKLKAPILVQTGSLDTNVPAAQQDELVAALRSRGLPVQYIKYDDEGHGLFKTATKVKANVATVEFFVENLKPKTFEKSTASR